MARVFQKTAAKDYPEHGIKKGDTYYTWTLRFSKLGSGTTYKSKTYPKASQTTSSPFYQQLYSLQERLGDLEITDKESIEVAASEIEEVASEAESLRDETQESYDNLPENFQAGDTGQLLEERISALDQWASELQDLAQELNDIEDETLQGYIDHGLIIPECSV